MAVRAADPPDMRQGSTTTRGRPARTLLLGLLLTACELALGLVPRSAPAAAPATAGPAERVTNLVIEPLAGTRALRVRFEAVQRSFELLLRAPAHRAGDDVLYRGRLKGALGSRAALAVRGGTLDGVIATADEAFALAPAARVIPGAAAEDTVVYRLAEVPDLRREARRARRSGPHVGDTGPAAPGVPRDNSGAAAGGGAPLAPVAHSADVAAEAFAPPVLPAVTINEQALAAIGQENLVANVLNQPGAAGLVYPYAVARDPSVGQTRLYVADTLNSRILGFECAGSNCVLGTFTAATRVFGQPDYTSFNQNGGLLGAVSASTLNFPRGVAVDTAGTLYVADTGNNRVLVYQSPWSDPAADVVIGQNTMSGATAGSGLNQLRAPEGVYVDAGGALWVADTGNNRVLKFATIATGASAAFAIGAGGAPSATTLSGPRDVFVDAGGALWVADTGFSRVLRYAPPLSAGKAATTVFGHGGSFTNGSANQGGLGAASLAFPEKLYVDGGGRLWVADTGNNRVLEYDAPLASQTANRVYGQADRTQVPTFATNVHDAPDGFPNAAGVWGPRGLTFDGNGTLWVCDRDNSRVLAFDNPLGGTPAAIVADRLLGKQLFVDASANLPTATRMNNPTGVAVDTAHTPNRLWVVDIGNNRVLGYDSTADLASDRAADVVLGQSSFAAGATNAGLNGALQNAVTAVASASSLFFPSHVAVDSLGGVYVADGSNSRVLHFTDPFGGDTVADHVFGQTNFSNRNSNYPYGTASSLGGVQGVSVGPGDDLWVADTLDHRVVRFANAPNQPATNGAANLVLGQAGFVSSNTFPPYSSGCAANRMNAPGGVFAAASGRVYVADSQNHRVLVFSPPFSNGTNATAVFGQANLTSCAANRGGAPSAATLSDPQGVYEDAAGNVYIADSDNNRVLVYDTPFGGGDLVADNVMGQPDFTTTTVLSPRPESLSAPSAVGMDAAGRLFIADRENSRVTEYATNSGPTVVLDPIPSPIVVGEFLALTGSGFTAGSVIKIFVATANGPVDFGAHAPDSWLSGILYWYVDPTIALGNGFATLMVINTDQGYIGSNPQSQLLFGGASVNIPTIKKINGVDLRPVDPTIPVANVETVIAQGSTVAIDGTGFNGPLVNLFTAAGNKGPLTPLPGGNSTHIDVVVPSDTPTGPGSFQVVNNPYTGNVLSNAVSVPIGALLTISSIGQAGTTVTVNGTGFSTVSVINLFNKQGASVVNLGGLNPGGAAKVPLTVSSPTQFTFTVPAGAVTGPAYVQVLNPPYIPYSSSGNDPDGAFTIVAP